MPPSRDDITYELTQLKDQLDNIQRHQMLANSRIRQDLVSILVAIAILGLAVLIIEMHWSKWWILAVAAIGQPTLQAYLVRHVQKREEP